MEPTRWLSARLIADRIIAGLAGIMLAPVIAIAAILVRRHDGERGLVQVPRVGRNGRVFGMWKIRSMYVETTGGRAAGAALTSSTDSRVTPIGRKIRKFHLDELPQLYNVAKGEMSILGPRPEAPQFVEMQNPDWKDVLSVPPGIAGPTQIMAEEWEKAIIDSDVTGDAYTREVVPVKLAIDRWYIENSSLRLDLLIGRSLFVNAIGRDAAGLKGIVFGAVAEAATAIRGSDLTSSDRAESMKRTGPAT